VNHLRGYLGIFALAGSSIAAAASPVDTIYAGGNILTMEGSKPAFVQALAVRDGKIAYVGTRAGADALKGPSTRVVNLQGKTLLPGFIDAHSHLLNYADSLVQADLNPPPNGDVSSIAAIIDKLRQLKAQMHADDTTWLIGQGYVQDELAEKRHPTAADLDAAFPTNPVLLVHGSGHMLVANSAALKIAGITAATPDPEGGTIIRIPGTREPEGLIQEKGMFAFVSYLKGARDPQVEDDLVRRAVEHYASFGVTTAAEHLLVGEKMPVLEHAAESGILTIDVVALPAYTIAKEVVGTGRVKWRVYANHLKYQGLKIAVDGSPQGKTAFLTEPYLTPVPGCTENCRGFPAMSQDEVNQLFLLAYRNNVQLYSHCNGDAAIDMMIKGHEYAEAQLGENNLDRRTVIIHSQIMRPDQMQAYRKYGLLPSFFTNHVYYFGDTHLRNLGPARAAYLSPLNSALRLGIRATNHTDSIVTPLDPLFLLWTAVNRVTSSGVLLGADERVSAYDGLRAMTVNGAYEYFEEASKGTLAPGKLADLVILNRNPLTADRMTIKDIKVVETIKEGRTVYGNR
jgi:predicted amidohydrolase YtcJ